MALYRGQALAAMPTAPVKMPVEPEEAIKIAMSDMSGQQQSRINAIIAQMNARANPTQRQYNLWAVFNTIEAHRWGSLSPELWDRFIRIGEIPLGTPGHYVDLPERKEAREREVQRLAQQIVLIDRTQALYANARPVAAFTGCIFLTVFLVTNTKVLMDKKAFKNIALAANTALVLAAGWSYLQQNGVVIALAMVVCAIGNAIIIIRKQKKDELVAWLSYTGNAMLVTLGCWQLIVVHDNAGVGYMAVVAGLLSSMQRFILQKRKSRTRKREPEGRTDKIGDNAATL